MKKMNNPVIVISVGDIIAFALGAIILFVSGFLWVLEKLFGEKEEENEKNTNNRRSWLL